MPSCLFCLRHTDPPLPGTTESPWEIKGPSLIYVYVHVNPLLLTPLNTTTSHFTCRHTSPLHKEQRWLMLSKAPAEYNKSTDLTSTIFHLRFYHITHYGDSYFIFSQHFHSGTLLPTPKLAPTLPKQEQGSFQSKAQVRHTRQYNNGLLPVWAQWEITCEAGAHVM